MRNKLLRQLKQQLKLPIRRRLKQRRQQLLSSMPATAAALEQATGVALGTVVLEKATAVALDTVVLEQATAVTLHSVVELVTEVDLLVANTKTLFCALHDQFLKDYCNNTNKIWRESSGCFSKKKMKVPSLAYCNFLRSTIGTKKTKNWFSMLINREIKLLSLF